jgi:hypothetical protein
MAGSGTPRDSVTKSPEARARAIRSGPRGVLQQLGRKGESEAQAGFPFFLFFSVFIFLSLFPFESQTCFQDFVANFVLNF